MKVGKSLLGRRNFYNWGLPALSGALMALSLPPLPLGWLAWVGLLPLFYSLEKCNFRSAFGLGYRAGLFYFFGALYWILLNSGAPLVLRILSMVGVLLILPLGWGLSTWAISRVRLRLGWMGWLAAPFIWTAAEMLFSIGESGFPWAIIALSQSRYVGLIQIVAVTGVPGITFWVVGLNALGMIFWQGCHTKSQRVGILLVIALWFLVPLSWGRHQLRTSAPPIGKITVGLVQGDVPAESKWVQGVEYNLACYEELTDSLVTQTKADSLKLVVWTETAIPTYLEKRWQHRRLVHSFVDSIEVPLITGASDYQLTGSGDVRTYNSAFLFIPGSTELQGYHKIHPVPFGERIPFQRFLPFLGSFRLGQAEFTPGTEYTVFSLPKDTGKFSVLICFESIFSDLTRKFVRNGAEFLVNITNDGWFGRCSEPYQHLELSRFRAIENHRWLVRAANTGVSAFIDANGNIVHRLPLNHRDVLAENIELRNDMTFYVRYGNWFPIMCCGISLVLIFTIEITRKRVVRR
jgi:apolipoprotein N-acyltransferase